MTGLEEVCHVVLTLDNRTASSSEWMPLIDHNEARGAKTVDASTVSWRHRTRGLVIPGNGYVMALICFVFCFLADDDPHHPLYLRDELWHNIYSQLYFLLSLKSW